MNKSDVDKCIEAGKISQRLREYIKEIVEPGRLLDEIADLISDKIEELGARAAFPVSLAIDDVAAHFSPNIGDDRKAEGLLKVDFGIAIDGFIADSAISIDLTEDNRHKELIESVELALDKALSFIKEDPTIGEIGDLIGSTIESKGFSPVVNLSGHSIDRHQIHAGITIPNYNNGNSNKLGEGLYAVEPFATTGEGRVYNGGPGNVYELIEEKSVRSPIARKVLSFIVEKYKTLPFALRDVEKEFGGMVRLGMRELEQQGIIQHHLQLVEKSHKPVAQAEHTFIKKDGEVVVSTKD
ncbi:type II methionyl aminopeptidase [Candidatus Pacearchaeota archaeon]|nr:type II methionyl aminopeptidase [Candidatus Pacearchaeota archaeon]